MGIFDGCLLACDVDGTIESGGEVNPRNIEKIHYFMSEGGHFSLASGRGPEGILPIVRKLGKISASIVSNGCIIYDTVSQKVLSGEYLPENDKHFVCDIIKNVPSTGIEVHIGETTYNVNRNNETDDHENHEEISARFVDVEKIMDTPWNKVIFMPIDDEGMQATVELTKGESNSKFVHTCAIIKGVQRNYYEQLPLGVSKAQALTKLKKIYNIKENSLFAIGDYYNDLEMLLAADISAATAEAPQQIKSECDYIACSCKDGAVADFIDYLTNKYLKLK